MCFLCVLDQGPECRAALINPAHLQRKLRLPLPNAPDSILSILPPPTCRKKITPQSPKPPFLLNQDDTTQRAENVRILHHTAEVTVHPISHDPPPQHLVVGRRDDHRRYEDQGPICLKPADPQAAQPSSVALLGGGRTLRVAARTPSARHAQALHTAQPTRWAVSDCWRGLSEHVELEQMVHAAHRR
jgi:hypothetical protein